MAQQEGISTDRDEAIQQFAESAQLERNIMKVAQALAARNPAAVVILWEEDGQVRATSIPPSLMLVRGMVDGMHELLFSDSLAEDYEDE